MEVFAADFSTSAPIFTTILVIFGLFRTSATELRGCNSMTDESSESTLTPTPFSTTIMTTAAPCSNYSDQFNSKWLTNCKLFKDLFNEVIQCNESKLTTVFNVSLQCRDDSFLWEVTSNQPFNISAGKITCADCPDEAVSNAAQLDIRLANGTLVDLSTVGDAYVVDDNNDCPPQSTNSSSVALSFSFYTTSYYNVSAVNITVSKEDRHSNVTSWNLELFHLTETIATEELARNVCSDNSSPSFVEECCMNSVENENGEENSNNSCSHCTAFEFPDLSLNSSEPTKLILLLEVYFRLCQDIRSSNTSLSIFNTANLTVTNRFVVTQRDKNDTVPRALVMFWDLTPGDVKYLTVSGEAMDSVEKIILHWIYDYVTSFPSSTSPSEQVAETAPYTSVVSSSSSSSSATTLSTTTSMSSSSTTTTSPESSSTTIQSTKTSFSIPTSSTSTTTTSHSEPSTSSSSSSSSPSKPSSTTLPTTPVITSHSSSTSTPATSSTPTLSSTSTTSSTSSTSTTEYYTSTAPSVKVFNLDPFRLADEGFTEDLKRKTTPAYQRLFGIVFPQLSAICKETIPDKFLNVSDMSFSEGSVIVNSTIDISTDLSEDEKRKLNAAVQDRFKNSLNIVAIVVGSVVGLLLIIIVVLLFILCFRQWRKDQTQAPPSSGSLSDPVEPTDSAPGPYVIRRPSQLLWQSSVGTSSLTRRCGQQSVELSAREASGEGGNVGDGEKQPQGRDRLRGGGGPGSGAKGPALTHFATTNQEDERGTDWNGVIPRPGLDVWHGHQTHRTESTKAFDYPFGPTMACGGSGSWGLSDTSGTDLASGGVSDKRAFDGRGSRNVSSPKDLVSSGSSPLFCERQAFFPGNSPAVFQVTSSPSPFEVCLPKQPVQTGGPPARDPYHPCDFEGLFVPVLAAEGRSEFSRNSSNRNPISHSHEDVNAQSNADKTGDGEFNWGSLHDDVLTHYGSKRSAPAQLLAIFQGTISRGSKPDTIHRAPPSSQPNKSKPQRTQEMGPDSGV